MREAFVEKEYAGGYLTNSTFYRGCSIGWSLYSSARSDTGTCSNMAETWLKQQRNPDVNSLSFDERFGLLVAAEYTHRENRKVARRLSAAKLRHSQASIEDLVQPAK